MSAAELILLALAGVAAGIINTVVGSGTLVTFPTLLTLGVPPVTATMSNAVGLVAGGVSGTWGYRRELRGQWSRLRWQIPASLIGSVIGAWLLLHLPENTFTAVVPALLVLALGLVIAQPWIQRSAARRSALAGADAGLSDTRLVLLVLASGLTAVYGGYFAAAQGILLMALMGIILTESMQRINAAKNLLTLLVNIVSASTYTLVAFDRINWAAAGVIAVGSLIGGFVGAAVGRRLSPLALRVIIVALGVVALWRLLG